MFTGLTLLSWIVGLAALYGAYRFACWLHPIVEHIAEDNPDAVGSLDLMERHGP